MESVRLKAKETVYNHCILADKVVSYRGASKQSDPAIHVYWK